MHYCDNCGNIAGERKQFRDPNSDEKLVEKYFCSPPCEEELEKKFASR